MPVDNKSAIPKPGSRLRELGLVLPKAPTPLGAYVEASSVGSLLFLSGILPVVNGKLSITGRLGENLSVEQGREAVRIAAMNALAVAQQHLGDLDRLKKLVKWMEAANVLPFDQPIPCGGSELSNAVVR